MMVNEKYPNCPIDVFAKRTSLYGASQTMFAWLLMMTSSILLQVCETWQLPQINGAIGTPEKSYQRLEDKICELQRSVQNVEASNVAKAEDLFGRGPEKDPRLRSVSCCWSHVVKPKINFHLGMLSTTHYIMTILGWFMLGFTTLCTTHYIR